MNNGSNRRRLRMSKIAVFTAAGIGLAGIGIALAGMGTALASSATAVSTYRSALATGSEIPKPKAPATAKGLFMATVTVNGSVRTMRWTLTFSGISGKATAAHIHKGKAGVAGGVLLSLCGPCKTGQTGQARVSKDAAAALAKGLAYVNVHTARNAAGEVRGQVRLVKRVVTPSTEPEPTPTTPDPGEGGDDPPPYGY